MDIIVRLDDWFADRLQGLQSHPENGLKYNPETVAYVGGVLKTLAHPHAQDDLSGKSIVLTYAEARLTGDFATFQRLGDWILFSSVVIPESIAIEREAVDSIGQLSYYACHRIMRESWPVYGELADHLPAITAAVRLRLM